MTDADFVQAACARVQAARTAHGMIQVDMARVLGVSRAAYQRYESRTPLPHHLLEDFVTITGVDIRELFGVV